MSLSYKFQAQLALSAIGSFFANGQSGPDVNKTAAQMFADGARGLNVTMVMDHTPYGGLKEQKEFAKEWKNLHPNLKAVADQKPVMIQESTSENYYVAAADALDFNWSTSRRKAEKKIGHSVRWLKSHSWTKTLEKLYNVQDKIEDDLNRADYQGNEAKQNEERQALLKALLPQDQVTESDNTRVDSVQVVPQQKIIQPDTAKKVGVVDSVTAFFKNTTKSLTDSIAVKSVAPIKLARTYHPAKKDWDIVPVQFQPGSKKRVDKEFLIQQCIHVGFTEEDARPFVDMINNHEAKGLNLLAHNSGSGADLFMQAMPETIEDLEKAYKFKLPKTKEEKLSLDGIRKVAFGALKYRDWKLKHIRSEDQKRIAQGKEPVCGQQVVVDLSRTIKVKHQNKIRGRKNYHYETINQYAVTTLEEKGFALALWAGDGYYTKVASLMDQNPNDITVLPVFGKKFPNQKFGHYVLHQKPNRESALLNQKTAQELEKQKKYHGKIVAVDQDVNDLFSDTPSEHVVQIKVDVPPLVKSVSNKVSKDLARDFFDNSGDTIPSAKDKAWVKRNYGRIFAEIN